MTWMARSSDPRNGGAEQTYARHIQGVAAYVKSYLEQVKPFISEDCFALLHEAVSAAAIYHDLGKLDDSNQQVLKGEIRSRSLPHIHSDAGCSFLSKRNFPASVLIASHHTQLPNFVHESNREENAFRVEEEIDHTDQVLDELLRRHHNALGNTFQCGDLNNDPPEFDMPLFMRMALSMLVDADYSDSSRPNMPVSEIRRLQSPELRAEERLKALDQYVAGLAGTSDRSRIRQEIYRSCRNHQFPLSNIVSCDSPVGTGKTTAVMANLLASAVQKKLRRIFVILPFTNIIHQSVEVYRKALVLPGENPDDVVAEIHHLADFEDEQSRDFAACWHAPIIVTTAVAFFETIASAHPAGLRRLHQLIGAGIFVDEVHAAMPANLLPPVWHWIKTLSDEWSCFWILASGSLNQFWKIPEIDNDPPEVPALVTEEIRRQTLDFEHQRLVYKNLPEAFSSAEALSDFIAGSPGPRLVILNTVQNAAVTARTIQKSQKFSRVFHLSTALTPADREVTLRQVREEMQENPDGNWVLVGTSCIEAGIDLDFATGFRENASLVSLLQAGGRINRNGRRRDAVMYSFSLSGDCFSSNKGLRDSIYVLEKLIFGKNIPVSPDLCTEAMRLELKLNPGQDVLFKKILDAEGGCNFPLVEELFKIINADTRLVVIDKELVVRIENYESVSWKEIQRKSVQIWGYKLDQLHIPAVSGHPGIYKWPLLYDDFIGYMAGILTNEELFASQGGIL